MCLWVGSVYVAGCWAGGVTGTAVFKLTCVRHPLGNWGCDLTSAHVSGKCIGSSGGGLEGVLEEAWKMGSCTHRPQTGLI